MSSPPLKKRHIFHRDTILPRSTTSTAGEDVMKKMSHDRSKSTTNVNIISVAKTIGDAVNSLETHFQCSICFDVICKSQRIPECGHRFCRDCIKTSINKCKRECPVCRCPVISTRNLREEKSFDDLILSFRGVQKIIKEQIDQLQGLQEMIPQEINVNPKKKTKAPSVEEREKELEKRREESRKIQEKEVPAVFHHDVHDVKGNKDRKRDISRKLKKSYACAVKEGMSGTKENV